MGELRFVNLVSLLFVLVHIANRVVLRGISLVAWNTLPGSYDSESGGPSCEGSSRDEALALIRKNAPLMTLVEGDQPLYTEDILLSYCYEKVSIVPVSIVTCLS